MQFFPAACMSYLLRWITSHCLSENITRHDYTQIIRARRYQIDNSRPLQIIAVLLRKFLNGKRTSNKNIQCLHFKIKQNRARKFRKGGRLDGRQLLYCRYELPFCESIKPFVFATTSKINR